MTIESRNNNFLEHQDLIRWTIYRNMCLIQALRLDWEDISQDLAISALKAIEKYDPTRGASLKTFLCDMLQYAILTIKQKQNITSGKSAGVSIVPLSRMQDDDSEDVDIDVPVFVDFDDDLYVGDILSRLTEPERTVLDMRLAGARLTTERQKQHYDRLQRKVLKFYVYPNARAAR